MFSLFKSNTVKTTTTTPAPPPLPPPIEFQVVLTTLHLLFQLAIVYYFLNGLVTFLFCLEQEGWQSLQQKRMRASFCHHTLKRQEELDAYLDGMNVKRAFLRAWVHPLIDWIVPKAEPPRVTIQDIPHQQPTEEEEEEENKNLEKPEPIHRQEE